MVDIVGGGPVEKVDHPSHYNSHPSGVECIEITEHFNYNVGNAIKYLWRAGLKPGSATLEDLKKASWFVEREISRIENEIDRRESEDSGSYTAD